MRKEIGWVGWNIWCLCQLNIAGLEILLCRKCIYIWEINDRRLSFYLVVSTHLKYMSQIGSFPQIGVNRKNLWNHHLGGRSPLHASSGITHAKILGPCFFSKDFKPVNRITWVEKHQVEKDPCFGHKSCFGFQDARGAGGFTLQRQRENFRQYSYGWFNIRLVLWDRKIWILISGY